MAVAHAEIVTEIAPVQVRTQDKAILVDLVRVVRYKPHARGEGVFSDDISLNQLRLHPFHLLTKDFLAMHFSRSGGSALKLRVEVDFVVVEGCEISRLIDLSRFKGV